MIGVEKARRLAVAGLAIAGLCVACAGDRLQELTVEPVTATVSDARAPPSSPPEATTRCEIAAATTLPVAECGAVPESEVAPFPAPGPGAPGVTAVALAGRALYAGLVPQPTCVSGQGCFTPAAAVFRLGGNSAWEPVIPEAANVLLALRDEDLYWVSASDETSKSIHLVETSTLLGRIVATDSNHPHVTGFAAASGSLLTLSAAPDRATSTLERRSIGVDGTLGAPQALATINGFAVGLETNGNVTAWTEPVSVVVADMSGQRRYVAALPSDTVWRVLRLTDRFAFAMFEREMREDWSYSVCAVDLESGQANVLVPPRDSIRGMAANSSHVFWIEARDADSYQVWAQPLAGGPPRVIACSESAIQAIAANDEAVYWLGTDVHRLDPSSL